MRAEVCKVLGDLTGAPALLGPDRLLHYCRGKYEKCLFPEVWQRESLLAPGFDSDGQTNQSVDFGVLERVQKNYSARQLRARTLRAVYEYSGLPQPDSDENSLWVFRVTDEHMLRLYRDVISGKKEGRSGVAHMQAILADFPGIGVMTFRFLEEYLLERGLIEVSYFPREKHI